MVRTLALAGLLLLLAQPAAFADDEANGEDTAAARLFREAWWLETGVGALDRAQAKYEAAVKAEGSETVRARSLYRLAIVLQRMGRTEDAVRALERLAAEFPAETKYHEFAKARLEEWTSDDLKEAFADWYRRFQYSPEFQAKVIDLVLELGGGDHTKRSNAWGELSTIGEPALPALRAHASSTNSALAVQAIRLIFLLGEIPPTEALAGSMGWVYHNEWGKVMAADEATQARIRSELEGDEREMARVLRTALEGRVALVTAMLDTGREPPGAALDWALDGEVPDALAKRMHALIDDEGTDRRFSLTLGNALRADHGQLDRATVLGWLRSDDEELRNLGYRRVNLESVRAPDNWRVLAALVRANRDPNRSDIGAMAHALFSSLAFAPDDDDPAELVETLNHAMAWYAFQQALGGNAALHSPFARRAVEAYLTQARSEGAARLLAVWSGTAGDSEAACNQLVEWAANGKHSTVRSRAMLLAAEQWRWAPSRLLTPLGADPARPNELRELLFTALDRNRALVDGPWTREELRTLLQLLPKRSFSTTSMSVTVGGVTHRVSSPYGAAFGRVLLHFFADPEKRDEILAIASEDPIKTPQDLFSILPADYSKASDGRPVGLVTLETFWNDWTPDQCRAALDLFLDETVFTDDATHSVRTAFLRARLRAPMATRDRKLDLAMLRLLPVTLEDLTAVYDLDDPVDATKATYWLGSGPPTPEWYDAFHALLDPAQGNTQAIATLHDRFFAVFGTTAFAERDRDFVERALAHGSEVAGRLALGRLVARSSIADIPLWLAALRHAVGTVRMGAASGLGGVYNTEAVRGLAKAMDDDDPRVRDAALKSLERIKKIEDDKAYWRDFVETGKEVGK